MHKKEIIRRKIDSDHEARLASLPPVLSRIYAARAVEALEELEHTLDRLQPFEALLGIQQAVALIASAITDGQRILVVGDFDADGATSCALAVRALRAMGAEEADYLVPNRFDYGYGLTPEIVEVAARQNPQLLITVDNGISSISGVRAARENGMRVVVTDHHLAGSVLPEADAIVNPNQPGDTFPSKNLAGVGVIFYVMLAVRAQLREQGWFAGARAIPNMAQLLDLVALGTVADVVPLDRNNRILVEQGLKRIRSGQCCPGISALLQVAGRGCERLVASDLGFCVGPRLNAAGRLEDMSLGVECLLSDDPVAARNMAGRLDELNRERRDIESRMREQAMADIERLHLVTEDEALPAGLCLFDRDWHQGVIGILASRIKDRLHRPVIAFAPGTDGELKGSARSVPGLHIRDALDAIAVRETGLITKFGGHAMAAGLTLPSANLEAFRQAFQDEVRRRISDDDLRGRILTDGELASGDLGLELAELLRQAGPWGQSFPEPLFDNVFEVVQWRVVGEKHAKMVVRVPGQRTCLDAIAFNALEQDWPELAGCLRFVYRLDVNEYRGERNPQLIVEHVETPQRLAQA